MARIQTIEDISSEFKLTQL